MGNFGNYHMTTLVNMGVINVHHQIMLERGIYRIYDCGNITYSLMNK